MLNETFSDNFSSLDGKVWDTIDASETWDGKAMAWDDVDPRNNYERSRRSCAALTCQLGVTRRTRPSPESIR